ncbi:ankyrin repeat protein [Verticillium alfalfae VaMs.102]|uniref:Ankyrin repeat protein n=1 Tax=Verticillium alfalfae (strain VaMs.102 / ATCC MYA-4576 / FGSC 10136) TaxID=526221 RepID=C9SY00_VERA1|nr:ankyrin repeat protein [Verticillium alfalfae VaMs.102]EEY23665.1 ankyrin repeat protein [Verticillium alfalfae VaMs.102]
MAEVLGLSASIIAIVDLSAKLASHCKFYVENVKDARADFRKLLIEITSVVNAVDILKFLIEHDPDFESDQLLSLSGQSGSIAGCLDALTQLEAMLPPSEDIDSGNSCPSTKSRMKNIATRLAWPLKKTRAMGLLDDIMKHKATMQLAMIGDISKDVKEIETTVGNIQKKLTNDERYRLLDWLTIVNPSSLHYEATALYEEGTGDWVSRDLAWQKWVDPEAVKPKCLWLKGIPGAGKTVLASHLFHSLELMHQDWPALRYGIATTSNRKRQHGNSLSIAHIYYYCHHTRNHDESLPFLRWIVNEMCRQSEVVPQQLIDIHRSGRQPSIQQLLNSLVFMINMWDSVYIMIDALDESKPRTELLKLLHKLGTEHRFQNLKILATSRIYPDIKDNMEPIATSIDMSNPFVEDDIRKFTFNDLERRRTTDFKYLNQAFMNEAAGIISVKAEGMFRWAVCQIDTLRRIQSKGESFLRQALLTMPKGLDAAYDRIFQLITEEIDEDDLIVRDALSWIRHHKTLLSDSDDIPVRVLIQAIHPETRDPQTSDVQFLLEEQNLRNALGCLVAVSQNDRRATKYLLEAGADVNASGVQDGHLYGPREHLSRFNSLQGISPLYIHERLRNRCGNPWDAPPNKFVRSKDIGRYLRERGARAERTSQPGSVQGCGIYHWDNRSDDEVSVDEVDFSSDTDLDSDSEEMLGQGILLADPE